MTSDPAEDSEWHQAQSDLYFGDDLPPELSFGGLWTLGFIKLECARRMSASGKLSSWCERMARHLFAIDNFDHHLLQIHHECIASHFRAMVAGQAPKSPLPAELAERRLEMIRRWREHLLEEVLDLMRDPEIARAFAIVLVYRNFAVSERVGEHLDRLLLARYGKECMSDWFMGWVAKRMAASGGYAP